jgi:hypothetical protein
MAFVSIRARPAFRAGWMKGEQGFGDSITASIDCPATAGRSRQEQLLRIIMGFGQNALPRSRSTARDQCKSRDVFLASLLGTILPEG